MDESCGCARLAPGRLRGVSPRGYKAQEQPKTGQSLSYLAEGNLQPKILAIVEEQGARKADYGIQIRPRHANILSGLHSGWGILPQAVHGASRPVNSSHPPCAPFSIQKITG